MAFGKRRKKKDSAKYAGTYSLLTAYDKLKYYVIEEKKAGMEFDLADKVIEHVPIIVNFSKLDNEEINYLLSFLSGVVYSLEGEVRTIDTKVFLFAGKAELEDGSLLQYVEDNAENYH